MCLSRGGDGPPDTILDTTTLRLTLDNQGVAILQINILKKSKDPISNLNYTFEFDNAKFSGFIESDSMRKLEGSDYYEHAISAKGVVC